MGFYRTLKVGQQYLNSWPLEPKFFAPPIPANLLRDPFKAAPNAKDEVALALEPLSISRANELIILLP